MENLLKDFYTLLDMETSEGKATATLLLNEQHDIYKGHFPEVPVVPGVCQMQMTGEVLSQALGKKLQISSADNMKFVAIINPNFNKTLHMKMEYKYLEDDAIKVSNVIFFDNTVFFKFSGKFKVV